MGFFDIFNASAAAVETATYAVKKGIDGLDNMNFSEEEKAKHVMEMMPFYLKRIEMAMNETGAQTLSRRYLAWFIVGNSGLLSWAYVINEALPWTFTIKVGVAALEMVQYWHFALGAVVSFYFFIHGARMFKKEK